MNHALRVIGNIIGHIVMAWRSIFWKRDMHTVLIGAWFGEKFADNPRFLFQYLHENKESLGLHHIVWVTRNECVREQLCSMGYEVYDMDSNESIHYHKTAGIHIICNASEGGDAFQGDIMGKYSFGAKRISLGHGVGFIKGNAFDSNEWKRKKEQHRMYCKLREWLTKRSSLFRRFVVCPGGWEECYHLCASDANVAELKKVKLKPDYLYIKSSYPRTCMCPRLTDEEDALLKYMETYPIVILYLPTFRADYRFDYDDVAEFMRETLEEHHILWIEKPHSAEKRMFFNYNPDKNIIRLSSEFDINVIFPHITFLITDYSTARTDAMFHNKPILYYVPDYEEYRNGERGFVVDLDQELCGPKAITLDELREMILNYKDSPEQAKFPGYDEIRSKYWDAGKELGEIWQDIKEGIRV